MAIPLLHDYFRSSAAYRVRIGLNLKRVDYRRHVVNLIEGEHKTPECRALNPQGLIPMLEIDGLRLSQSLAILDYLDAEHDEPRFVPSDAGERSHVLAMALVVACDIHPLNNLRVLKYLGGPLGQQQEARDSWYRHWLSEGLGALEALAESRSGDFLFGDAVSLADICLVPQLYNARRFKVPVEQYATLARVDAHCTTLPAFADAHPDRQDDAH